MDEQSWGSNSTSTAPALCLSYEVTALLQPLLDEMGDHTPTVYKNITKLPVPQTQNSPRGEALGAFGAGRFFVLGLLVGVMPYQGCRDLGVDSGGAGAGSGAAGAVSSSSSSSSKGL